MLYLFVEFETFLLATEVVLIQHGSLLFHHADILLHLPRLPHADRCQLLEISDPFPCLIQLLHQFLDFLCSLSEISFPLLMMELQVNIRLLCLEEDCL